MSSKRRHHILCLFPGGGSFGEGTALYSFVRALPPKSFRITFLQVFGSASKEVESRYRILFKRYRHLLLFRANTSKTNELSFSPVKETFATLAGDLPDIVLLGGCNWYYDTTGDQGFIGATKSLLTAYQRKGIPIAFYDVSANVTSPSLRLPDRCYMISPRPLTFGRQQEKALLCHCRPSERRERKTKGPVRVLWAGSGIFKNEMAYQLVEKSLLAELLRRSPHVKLFSTPTLQKDQKGNINLLESTGTFEAYQKQLAALDLVIAPNKDSILAARAAALGVPIVLVTPNALLMKKHPSVLYNDRKELPIAGEFTKLKFGSALSISNQVTKLLGDLPHLKRRIGAILKKQEELPEPVDILKKLLTRTDRSLN